MTLSSNSLIREHTYEKNILTVRMLTNVWLTERSHLMFIKKPTAKGLL